jgi:acetylornithine aminotransferase/acetylornithine/N-succinyldiaminopimelate aminotransferase
LLIADEIQSGLGRTGRFFAYQHHGILPDVVTVAKPLAAGLPLGAILVRERVAGAIRPGLHGTTFGGGPLACAVALTFLAQLTPRRLAHIGRVGAYFRRQLEDFRERYSWIREVRGQGLMLGMELAFPGKEIVRDGLAHGIILNCTHDTVLRFLPPYIIGRTEVDEFTTRLGQVLARVDTKQKGEGNGSHPSRRPRRTRA